METANKLIYSSTKFFIENKEEYRITVTISLDDDCGCEKREAIALEEARKEKEAYNKELEERIQMWKSGEISQLSYYWFENVQPNVWLRIKNGKIETSKGIKVELTEAERLWRLIKVFHNGGKFQHDLALDVTGHRWAFNRYENDILQPDATGLHIARWKALQNNWDGRK